MRYLPNRFKKQSDFGVKNNHNNLTRFPYQTLITPQAKTGIKRPYPLPQNTTNTSPP
jgi:hypothetical protein